MAYLTGKNEHHTYLKRFFGETEKVDHESTFEITDRQGTWHLMPYGIVIEGIMAAPACEQAAIAATIRRIDFCNGDICDFLRHLGRGLIETALRKQG